MMFMRLVTACALAFAIASAGSAVAQKKEHAHEKESHFKVTPPPDIKAAWTLITSKVSDAEKGIAAKQLEPVHEAGEHLEAAVHVLKEKSTMVSGDKQKKLRSAIEQLRKAVDEMHHAAEDKDASRAGLGLTKIKSLLPLIQAQYPSGTLN
jgi:hypothetical protein